MFQYRFPNLAAICWFLLYVISVHETNQTPLFKHYLDDTRRLQSHLSRDAQHDINGSPDAVRQPEMDLRSPLIVLMSSDTISVAQLPMILYGNISEIYRLSKYEFQDVDSDQRLQPSSEDEEEDARCAGDDGEDDFKLRREQENEARADAREYEQMPHMMTVNASMSLGKSEWQQIAAGERDQKEVWQQPQQNTQTNMNRKDARVGTGKEEGGTEGKQSGQPRKRRRSNSSKDEDSGNNDNSSTDDAAEGNVLRATNSTSDAQTLSTVNNRAAEASDAQNVTSARFNNAQQQPNLASDNTSGQGKTPAEEGDKTTRGRSSITQSSRIASSPPAAATIRRVEFSDFGVHMGLGYAFAADTAGRIHRFRLLSGLQSQSTASATSVAHASGEAFDSTSENFSESDGANAIVSGGKLEFVPRQSSNESGGVDDSLPNSAPATTTTSNSIQTAFDSNHRQLDDHGNTHKLNEDSYDANRVSSGGNSDVTHEQSGDGRQHPAASGDQTVGPLRDSPISGGLQTSGSTRSNDESTEAKPQVIWSRNKYSKAHHSARAKVKASAEQSEPQQRQRQQLANDDDGHISGALSAKVDSNQLVGEEITLRSAAENQHQPQQQSEAVDYEESRGSGGQRQQPPSLRTELAVDWLNNLLFVLDKCRLLVMDFDGGNELVLIDDFNMHNRPIDIKVDPINDFLFWLQRGKFHNTIYKLDLSVLSMPSATQKLVSNTLRLRQSLGTSENGSNFDASELVPLVSHHYAHPIITNLPRRTKIFTIDHKHSKIYVPLVPAPIDTDTGGTADADQLRRDETEIFTQSSDNVTHLNSTEFEFPVGDEKNCSHNVFAARKGQILAYNLDGTDVGPFRTAGERSHISNLENIQDLTVDSANNLLYWLTNDGQDLVEEFKESETIQPVQHNLNGKSYSKLMYFDNTGSSQPTSSKTRFNVRKIIHILSSSISANRPTRSEGMDLSSEDGFAISLKVRDGEMETTKTARNMPFIILGVTCLVVITVYLTYALIFQRSQRNRGNDHACRDGSMSGESSITESQVDGNLNGFINSNTISRWIAGPSVRSTETSTFNRGASSANGQLEAYDIESINYGTSNAIDEHYRDSIANHSQVFKSNSDQLASLSDWPANICDRSNKLYVPTEVLQDEALSSIRRVSIDQLDIEKKSPLGVGHFGTVLQGTIRCTLHERNNLLEKSRLNVPCTGPISPDSLAPPSRSRIFAISSASSGHGSSSSTSCEFNTANSCAETNDEDYLTPKTQLNSVSSDYCADMPAGSSRDDSCIGYCNTTICRPSEPDSKVGTKLKVAIKKLKDNASPDEKRDFLQEAKLLANFNHPNIVHLIGICLDRGSTLIVMELMLGGDLIRYMQENTPNITDSHNSSLTYDDLLKVCLDIANGCCYLEDMDYIHRDLAARNCLVSSRKREERVVKLADFGLARDIYKDSYYKKLNDAAMPLKWMAPECLIEQKFTKKSDVWSFGVVLWEVMSYCQEKPYAGVEPFFMKEHLASGARLRKPINCDETIYRLMNQCWQMEPENRPTFHECRAMLIEIRNSTKM